MDNRIILIAPGWPNMPWFWDLVAMSSRIPLSLPNLPNLLTQPFNQAPHRNLTGLNLHAWLLEPQQSRSRGSLRQWQSGSKGIFFTILWELSVLYILPNNLIINYGCTCTHILKIVIFCNDKRSLKKFWIQMVIGITTKIVLSAPCSIQSYIQATPEFLAFQPHHKFGYLHLNLKI